ncbi:hypothetical protein SO802_014410 [Lithocarpus litseifolius]|uniref:Uncharacterized protein n=1 Tax=Lithocarpus litseifolius TaxID=425828 RepID=A0AAW2CRE8_9ROSI
MYAANRLGRADKHSKGGWALSASAVPCAHLCLLLGRVFRTKTKKIAGSRLRYYEIKLLFIVMYSRELRRNRRTKLKKKCYPKDALKEEVIKNKPAWADTQDYAVLVDYWFDPNMQTLVDTNKRSRGFQKDIARSGPISFAQTADNMAKESGQAVERATVFLKVYCTKDGSPVSNTVKEKIDKMNEILNNGCTLQGERREGILWAKDDAFAQVMGAERSGRVRGVGFGPTPSGRSGANLPCYTSTPPSSTETAQRMTSLENSHQSLRDQLAQSEQKHKEEIVELHAKHEEQIAEALAEAKRQSDAQHQKHMDEMMSSMRAMLDRLTPGVDFSGSLRCLEISLEFILLFVGDWLCEGGELLDRIRSR